MHLSYGRFCLWYILWASKVSCKLKLNLNARWCWLPFFEILVPMTFSYKCNILLLFVMKMLTVVASHQVFPCVVANGVSVCGGILFDRAEPLWLSMWFSGIVCFSLQPGHREQKCNSAESCDVHKIYCLRVWGEIYLQVLVYRWFIIP